MLQGADNKELKLGDFNLAVTADNPPAAYSQLSSDVSVWGCTSIKCNDIIIYTYVHCTCTYSVNYSVHVCACKE